MLYTDSRLPPRPLPEKLYSLFPCLKRAGIGNRLRVFDTVTSQELADYAALPPNARVHGLHALAIDGGARAVLAIYGDCHVQACCVVTRRLSYCKVKCHGSK